MVVILASGRPTGGFARLYEWERSILFLQYGSAKRGPFSRGEKVRMRVASTVF